MSTASHKKQAAIYSGLAIIVLCFAAFDPAFRYTDTVGNGIYPLCLVLSVLLSIIAAIKWTLHRASIYDQPKTLSARLSAGGLLTNLFFFVFGSWLSGFLIVLLVLKVVGFFQGG